MYSPNSSSLKRSSEESPSIFGMEIEGLMRCFFFLFSETNGVRNEQWGKVEDDKILRAPEVPPGDNGSPMEGLMGASSICISSPPFRETPSPSPSSSSTRDSRLGFPLSARAFFFIVRCCLRISFKASSSACKRLAIRRVMEELEEKEFQVVLEVRTARKMGDRVSLHHDCPASAACQMILNEQRRRRRRLDRLLARPSCSALTLSVNRRRR